MKNRFEGFTADGYGHIVFDNDPYNRNVVMVCESLEEAQEEARKLQEREDNGEDIYY